MDPIELLPDWAIVFGGDILSFIWYTLLLGNYYFYSDRRTRRDPTQTIQGINNIARAAWAEDIMTNRRDILAVQTLRNSTMAATFLASTAVLLIIGVLSLSGQQEKLNDAWHALNAFGAKHTELWIIKLMLLLLDFFVAFFAFSLAVRTFNHVGYLVNVPASHHHTIKPAHVGQYLNQAGRYYTIGMRAYYIAIPVVFWLFGPLFMVIATAVLLAVLMRIDRAPQAMTEDVKAESAGSERRLPAHEDSVWRTVSEAGGRLSPEAKRFRRETPAAAKNETSTNHPGR